MTTQITQLPSPPQHTDSPAVFSTKGDNFIAALPNFVTEVNNYAVELNTNLNSSSLGAITTSTTSLTIGTGNKTLTVEANLKYVAGMTLKVYNSTSNYMIGDVVSYSGTSLVVNVYNILGSGTFASWSVSPTVYYTPNIQEYVLTSNATLDQTVSGRLMTVSGSITISTASATVLGNGWYVWIRNVGVRDVTIDPNGAELIGGLSTAILKGGSVGLLKSSGTSFQLILMTNTNVPDKGFKNRVLITSSQSWSKPAGVTRARVYAVGKGADAHATNGSGGGGGLAWGDVGFDETVTGLSITINSTSTTISMFGAGTIYTANAATGVTGGSASINSVYVFDGGASTGGAGGGVGGASSGSVFGTGIAGNNATNAGGSGWGGNGGASSGGGLGSASGAWGAGATGSSGNGRTVGNEFTDPLLFSMTSPAPLTAAITTSTSPSAFDGVGGVQSSGNNCKGQDGGFGAGGGSGAGYVAGMVTGGNGGFGGGGGSAQSVSGGSTTGGSGGFGGGGGKAFGGTMNAQGVGGAGAVIILY